MDRDQIYTLLKSSVEELKKTEEDIQSLDDTIVAEKKIFEYGLDIFSFGELERDLENRLDGRKLNFESFMVPENFYDVSMGQILDHITGRLGQSVKDPIVVYVDDEEENLFIFKRKFGKVLTLKTFSAPEKALEYIKSTENVTLVITDEVMPGLTGNQLCDEVKKVKPYMNFILITGNPENDDQLMYKSLRHSRFYEFIQKPVDFDNKYEEYLGMINGLIQKNA